MTTDFIAIDEIHDAVREHYAGNATKVLEGKPDASCCSSGCECGYSAADVQELPADVTQASWGCGDPVTWPVCSPVSVVVDLGAGAGWIACLPRSAWDRPAG